MAVDQDTRRMGAARRPFSTDKVDDVGNHQTSLSGERPCDLVVRTNATGTKAADL
jgi:hypothetical protein